ncbi:MAG: M1 family metallopeptidase [Myxococcota bacterium]
MRLVALLVVLSLPGSALAQDWYDPTPLLPSLRASARAELPAAAGVSSLDVLPLYDLAIELDPDHGRYRLEEEIFYTNTTGRPLREIVLRVYANSVPGPAPVTLQGLRCRPACRHRIESRTAVVVRPTSALAPGERLRIEVELDGRLRYIDSSRTNALAQGLESLSTLASGEHAGDYGLLARGDGIASMANFYAVLARRRDDRWVSAESSTMGDLGPDAMGHVRARITVPDGVAIAVTGRIASRQTVGRQRRYRIQAAMVRDFALLASRDFQTETRRVGDVRVRSHFLPQDRASGERVLDVAARALRIFQRRFGPYPYADLDVVEAALVGGAGGVEFAGLVTVASMMYRPMAGGLAGLMGATSQSGAGAEDTQAALLEFVTAHEIAHQYWHGIVGSDSRDHPFVDESLAQWSAMLYLRDRYGAARAERDADMQVRMNYQMMRMMGMPDAPVDRPVDAFSSPIAYAGLVYGKGPYLYPELRRAVGDRAFFSAVREYVRTYRYQTAPPNGLFDLLAQGRRGARVRDLQRHWLEETHGDADLGEADVGEMVGSMLGASGGGGPELQEALQLFQQLQAGDTNGTPDAADLNRLLQSLGGGSGVDVNEALQILEQLP